LPEPRPRITLEVIDHDGSASLFHLGPHTPRLRPQDLELMHNIWLEITSDPRYRNLHHYDIVALALKTLQEELHSDHQQELRSALDHLAESHAGNPPHSTHP
jgi:hypothetical protein